ncbi:Acyl-CoA synthetase (AMP-forming)/AMP-acid ligase II [Candidatus Methylacidithermus pantelleriae]|uniref:Acyl-CoA synthetase (AMP-forming)/AMP-acid ligase II n=2 Tax=Candidatus Methylacidithermus pantelleriae TaxID=2744239 RepID=A0A8J2BN94_9BACT|nr:Acyl-CoA synthetase (AMP-forming)/AMP-acid ligase II [Candidatus Methylacidithermus pantelleriae]
MARKNFHRKKSQKRPRTFGPPMRAPTSLPESSPLWDLWLQTARRFPKETAMFEADSKETRTFQELTEEAWAMARSVPDLPPGSSFAYYEPNGIAWIRAFLACQARGWVALPLDSTVPEPARAKEASSLGAHYLWQQNSLLPLRAEGPLQKNVLLAKVSSGTTGKPRVVHLRPENLLAEGCQLLTSMGLKREDRNLGIIPMGHSYGIGNLVLPLILSGIPLVCAQTFVPSQIPKWIRDYAITVFPAVPVIFRALSELATPQDLSPLRLAISAGSPLSLEVARRFEKRFGLPLHNFYGTTEAGGVAYDPSGEAASQRGAVGRPVVGVIVDISSQGRIRVKSRAAFGRYRWLTLPDLGRWNALGELELIGRMGQLVNVAGRKVGPAEVEAVLRSLPGVTDAWVGVEKRNDAAVLVGAVETSLSVEAVLDLLRERLPAWKIPRCLLSLKEFPRTARGKIALSRLKEEFRKVEPGWSKPQSAAG